MEWLVEGINNGGGFFFRFWLLDENYFVVKQILQQPIIPFQTVHIITLWPWKSFLRPTRCLLLLIIVPRARLLWRVARRSAPLAGRPKSSTSYPRHYKSQDLSRTGAQDDVRESFDGISWNHWPRDGWIKSAVVQAFDGKLRNFEEVQSHHFCTKRPRYGCLAS